MVEVRGGRTEEAEAAIRQPDGGSSRSEITKKRNGGATRRWRMEGKRSAGRRKKGKEGRLTARRRRRGGSPVNVSREQALPPLSFFSSARFGLLFPPSLFPPILTDCNAEEAPPLISIEGGEDGGLEDGWRIGGGGGEGLFF